MKNIVKSGVCMMSLSLVGLSTAWASESHTSVQLEMHDSSAPYNPASAIKGSTVAVVPAEIPDSEKLAALSLELKAPETRTRLKAVNGLGVLGSKAKPNLPALAQLLTDRSAGLESARAIRKIDPTFEISPAILARLVKRAKVAPERERVHSGWATTCESQAQALDTLAALGPSARSVIPDIVKLTHRLCVHEHVVAALDQMGTPDAAQVAQIAGGLQDKDPEARQAAVEYLAKSLPTPETIHSLGRAMNDPSSGVRLSALQALEQIHPEGEGRLPLLANYLQDPSPEIRQRAIYMVGQLGPDAQTAAPLLRTALKDSDPAIALTAAKFLARVDPQDPLLMNTLIGFMKDKGSAQAMQSAELLQSLHVHDARVDAALEPYRSQQALWQRISKASSNVSPEQLAENARTLKIEQLSIASGIVQDQPVHAARHFSASVGRLYCWTDVSIGTPPAAILHRWYRNGHLEHEEYLDITAPRTSIWSSAAIRPGQWKVDILPSGSNEPLATAVFTVAKKTP